MEQGDQGRCDRLYVPSADERVAVFDNDGTLWCEKPMPIQLDFILRRLVAHGRGRPELRDRQPWKAAYERDYGWFAQVMAEHYAGDDTNVRTLAGGILAAFDGISVEDFEAQAGRVPAHELSIRPSVAGISSAPTRRWSSCCGYLEANGFTNYIASGGGRDFMRPISQEIYGIPRERVIGSATALEYTSDDHGGTITHKAASRLPRRRPAEADPDLEPHRSATPPGRGQLQRRHPDARLHPASDKPSLRLLVLHDDAEREFDYTSGAEQALERAADRRLDGRQHQERLGQSLLTRSGCDDAVSAVNVVLRHVRCPTLQQWPTTGCRITGAEAFELEGMDPSLH